MPAIGSAGAQRSGKQASMKKKKQSPMSPQRVGDGEIAVALRDDSPKVKKPQIPIYILPLQKEVYEMYIAHNTQFFVAGLIFGNFLVSAIASQVMPSLKDQRENPLTDMIFVAFDTFFAWVFTIELFVNMYGSFWWFFWTSDNKNWNIFDFVIVWISIVALYLPSLPGVSVLRLFRAFRVFRLFKRVPELKKIIEGVLASLPAVANACVIIGLLMGIWAIMGVEFFGKTDDSLFKKNFRNFGTAMLSLFQIMTFDSWSSGIAWDIIIMYPLATIYFVLYVFIVGVVMMNVVVAILLEKYLGATGDDDHKEDDHHDEEHEPSDHHPESNPSSPRRMSTGRDSMFDAMGFGQNKEIKDKLLRHDAELEKIRSLLQDIHGIIQGKPPASSPIGTTIQRGSQPQPNRPQNDTVGWGPAAPSYDNAENGRLNSSQENRHQGVETLCLI